MSEPLGELTVRTVAMPADANAGGDIFGGWVLAQMDIAGGIAAYERARGRTATVGIEAMSFLQPVHVGDVLCVYTRIIKTGRSSITIGIEAWVRRQLVPGRLKVTEGIFTFVALAESGRTRPLPPEA